MILSDNFCTSGACSSGTAAQRQRQHLVVIPMHASSMCGAVSMTRWLQLQHKRKQKDFHTQKKMRASLMRTVSTC